ncbi:MAG: hypothetical protein P1P80_05995 [ANME-2 cluster archaeon]|nr:hypothetical protein [ANME-2 cluster archaeon]
MILTTALVLASAGCIQLEKTGPQTPDVSMLDLYVSDSSGENVENPVYMKGDVVFFTLKYHDVENFKSLDVSSIQYEFSRLKPVGMDVHQGLKLDGITFLDDGGSSISSVTLSPGESVLLSLVIPDTQEMWDAITAESPSNQSVQFNLVIKINGLTVPLQSNELTVTV